MIPVTLDQLAEIVGGDVAEVADGTRTVASVTIDSRTAGFGALFVPVAGDHADGHDFIPDAVGRGATGYLRATDQPEPAEPGCVVVDDPADALLGLGAWVRDEVAPFVVAVTGSQGKTTTKDLMAAAIGAGRVTVSSPGSYNNDLGVPLTCCRLEIGSEVLVAEIGSRGLGHIARLAGLIRPDVAVITGVGASHLELLGDIDTVARAKAELVAALGPDGVAVLNADDARVLAMSRLAPGPVVTFGLAPDADWRATEVVTDESARPRFTVTGPRGDSAEVRLRLPGTHNVINALAALAAADACAVSLPEAVAAMAGARVSSWRMEMGRTSDGVTVLNDAYNANPASTAAALDTLMRIATAGLRWAVLGLMAELGSGSAQAHREMGELAAKLGVDRLVVVGPDAAAVGDGALAAGLTTDRVTHVNTPEDALDLLREELRPGDAVLVKASRAVGLERVALALADHAAGLE